MLLKDKVALITGGAGLNGLGFATARLMASHGARVIVLDLARAGKLNFSGVVTRTVPLDAAAINDTLDRLEEFGEDVRVVVKP